MTLSRLLALGAGLLVGATVWVGCHKVPVTGRRQYNLVPDSLMRALGDSAYEEMLAGEKTLSGEDAEVLKRVGGRISKVTGESRYSWRYKLVSDEDTVNAWCLPGGKIAFYTGILPVLKNEAGMAFVMGHEVGHATAHHGAERLTQQLTVLGGMGALYLYLDHRTELSDDAKGLIVAAMGVGAEVGVLLPFSRKHEAEADVIGMMYMSRAGYPPTEAVKVWNRMQAEVGSSATPEFLSTHPSNSKRKANLRDWMSQANKRYERNKLSGSTTSQLWGGSSDSGSSGGSGKKSSGKKGASGK